MKTSSVYLPKRRGVFHLRIGSSYNPHVCQEEYSIIVLTGMFSLPEGQLLAETFTIPQWKSESRFRFNYGVKIEQIGT